MAASFFYFHTLKGNPAFQNFLKLIRGKYDTMVAMPA